jgi:ElaB/YqjD/DUF883 family membrane-anchored ribosome-binding protein
MGPGPDEVEEIRQQIDESRENLGVAVGALAYKADVKNRGKEALEDKKEAIMEKANELKSKLPGGGDSEGGIGETIKSKLPSGENVSDKVEALKSKMPDSVGEAASRAGDKMPSSDDVKAKAQEAAATAGEHPIATAAGAAAAGLVAGLALPETDLERQKLAPAAQDARAQAQAAARDAVQQAKAVAKDVASSAAEAVKQAGQQHGGKLGEAAEKAADKTQDQVNPSS